MMRNLMRLMAISIMAVTAAAVTSCGKEEAAGEKTADELLGTWQLVKEVDEFDGGEVYSNRLDEDDIFQFTFKGNGKLLVYDGYDDDLYDCDYFFSQDSGTLVIDDGDESQVTMPTPNKLILSVDLKTINIEKSRIGEFIGEFDGLEVYSYNGPNYFNNYCYKSGRKYYACRKMLYADNDDYYFYDKTISYFDRVK